MEKKYHGVIPPIITPILPDETVDEEGFKQLIDYCIGGGLQGIFVCGSNGECMALTQKERNHAIKVAVDQIGDRVPLMVGVMDTSTQRVIDNVKAAEDLGAKCAVVTPVFYDRHTSQDETVRHMEAILQNSNIDLMLYNIPLFTGQKLTGKTMIEVAKLDKRVVGLKDTGGDFAQFATALEELRDDPDFSVLQGNTALGMVSLGMGADGYVPAMSTAFPKMFAMSYEEGKSGDPAVIKKYNALVRETSKILGMSKNGTAAAKYAISLRGFTSKQVIRPQDVTTPEDEAKIKAKMAEIDEKLKDLGLFY